MILYLEIIRKLKKLENLLLYLMRNRNSKLNKQKYDKYKFDKKVNAFQFFKYISFIIIFQCYIAQIR